MKRDPLSTVLMALVLAGPAYDIRTRTQVVHAQSPGMYYLQTVLHPTSDTLTVTTKGRDVVSFSCADGFCYVLSK